MTQISTFKRMALMLVMMMGILPVIGQTTFTSTFTSKKWDVGAGEPTWTASEEALQLEGGDDSRGVQWGKNKGTVTLTSDATYTQVTKVVVVASSNGDDGVITVKVVDATGEVELTTESTLVNKDRNVELEFSSAPAPSGKIVITASEGNHSIWIKSISVTAQASDGNTSEQPGGGDEPGGGDQPGGGDEPGGDVTPVGEGIALNNAFFGTQWGGSKPAGEPDDVEGQDEETGVIITYSKGEGSSMYINDSQIRLYGGNTLTIASTDGVNIAELDFTVVHNEKDKVLEANVGKVVDYKWTGDAEEVVFNVNDGSGHLRISHVKVTFVGGGEPIEVPTDVTVTVSSALVASYSCNFDLDFTDVKGLSAWTATAFGDYKVMLSRTTIVPAGTGVILKADKQGEYTIPTTSDNMYYYSNLFVGLPNGGTILPSEMYNGEKFLNLYFALSSSTSTPAFFPITDEDGKVFAKNKMYLHLPARLLPEFDNIRDMRYDIEFEDDATGINDVSQKDNVDNSNVMYNLNGQRIVKATKGMYIMNGKKMLVK